MRPLLLVLFSIIILSSPCLAANKAALSFAASNWPPFIYLDESGKPQGLYYDIITEIFGKELGLEINCLIVPWKRAQYYVESGKSDFLITVETEERLQYASSSSLPLLKLYLHIFTHKNHPQLDKIRAIDSVGDIKRLNLTPVTNIGNSWHERNIDSLGVETHYVPDEESALQVISKKRADITIEPIYAGCYLIDKMNLQDSVIFTDAKFGPIDMHLLFSKNSPHHHLMGQIDTIIQKLSASGRLEEISNKYITAK